MDFLKSFVIIIFIFTAVLSISPAYAQTAALGHISASVVGALNVSEVFPIKFGNFAITCTSGTCDALSTIVLSDQGMRTATSAGADTIALLSGGGAGTNFETGAQSPGFYSLNAGGEGSGTQHVYVSFADANGAIIDINHPANHVFLSGPVANAFTIDTFTFESDTGTTGYIQQNPAVTDAYGTYVPLVNGVATLRVGATLHTVAGPTPTPGQYTGTFNIMVSF